MREEQHWSVSSMASLSGRCAGVGGDLPVRMFWNACSTLEASRAEVSMKERLFSAVHVARGKEGEEIKV